MPSPSASVSAYPVPPAKTCVRSFAPVTFTVFPLVSTISSNAVPVMFAAVAAVIPEIVVAMT